MQVKIDFTSKKGKKKFANFIVTLAIVNINLFTGALFWLAMTDHMMVPDALITCFFSFWGIEMLSLASIRKCKARYNQSYDMNLEEQQMEEEMSNEQI